MYVCIRSWKAWVCMYHFVTLWYFGSSALAQNSTSFVFPTQPTLSHGLLCCKTLHSWRLTGVGAALVSEMHRLPSGWPVVTGSQCLRLVGFWYKPEAFWLWVPARRDLADLCMLLHKERAATQSKSWRDQVDYCDSSEKGWCFQWIPVVAANRCYRNVYIYIFIYIYIELNKHDIKSDWWSDLKHFFHPRTGMM